MSASRPIAVSGFGDDTEDEDDEAENSVGAKRVLARLGVAMARSNRNDEAALALRQAVLMKLPAGAEEDAALDFEARENLGMVVNRLFQPLDAYMAFAHGALLGALQRAIKGAVPRYVLDVGGGATGGLAAMLAAQAGAERVIVYESFKVRAAVVRDVLAANGVSDRVKMAELDLLDQPRPTPMQRDQPADTLMLDVAAHFGTDLLNSALIPTVTHARDAGFLAEGVTVIPARLHLVVCLVESEALAELEEVRQDVEGFDIRAFNKFSRDTRRIQLSTLPHRKLSHPTRCHTVNLEALARRCVQGDGKSDAKVNLVFHCEGVLHGVVYWYEVDMGIDGTSKVSMGPGDEASLSPVSPAACHPAGHVSSTGEIVSIASPSTPSAMTRSLSEDHLLERDHSDSGNKTWQMVWLYGHGNPFVHGHMGRALALSVGVGSDGSLDLSILPPPIPPIYITGFGFYMPSPPAHGERTPSGGGREVRASNVGGGREVPLPLQGGVGGKGEEEEEEEEEEEDPFTQCKGIPLYHFSMINDLERARAYALALQAQMRVQRQALDPRELSVLDLGCGSGLLAMLAARAGARTVYACDKAPGMASCAARVVQDNLLQHSIKIIAKLSTNMTVGPGPDHDMPERAGMLVSETFGDDPFSESFLPSLAHAREHLLTHDALVIPYGLDLYAVPFESKDLIQLNFVANTPVLGFDMKAWDLFARPRWSCRLEDHCVLELSEPCLALSLDWGDSSMRVAQSGQATTSVCVKRSGVVHGVAAWYTLRLDKEAKARISTAPGIKGRHWRQAVFFMGEADRREVAAGDSLSLTASYLRDRMVFKLE